jgi:hypothetical protein
VDSRESEKASAKEKLLLLKEEIEAQLRSTRASVSTICS